jgi:malonyl CoA-acyl carrier protein transacylase
MKKKTALGYHIFGLAVGIAVGALLWNLLLAGKIDALYKRNRYLETMVEDYRTKLEKLEQSQQETEQTLKDVVVEINVDDELEKIVLQQAVKQKYDILLGKKTNQIDIDLVIEVVDNRLFRTDNYQYQLHVDRVALSSKLTLWITAIKQENNTQSLHY